MAKRGVNKVIIVGNLGTDPQEFKFDNGSSVCTFTVATSEFWQNEQGEQQEETEWHRIAIFGKLADICMKYLKKGGKVYLEGKNKTRKYTDKDGIERYATEVICTEMQMLNSKEKSGYDEPL